MLSCCCCCAVLCSVEVADAGVPWWGSTAAGVLAGPEGTAPLLLCLGDWGPAGSDGTIELSASAISSSTGSLLPQISSGGGACRLSGLC